MDPENNAPEPVPDVIVCRVTPWYYRRMGLTFLFLLAFGLYFFYDGKIGYRNDNQKVEVHKWFEDSFLKSYEDARKAGTLDQWIAQHKAEGLPTGENGEPPKWSTFAAQKGWAAEPPKHHSEAEIAQQFQWGGAMILGAVVVAVMIILNRGKTFTGYPDRMKMPNDREVRFADVFKVDKRKWDHKGLAYVYYRTASSGAQQRATVDDLKFGGADKVLTRLLASFSGELIEKAPEETAPEPETPAPPKS